MKKITLAILGLACLMAVPNVAHARYADGMNMYQYVRSNSIVYVDPFADTATRPSDATRELAMRRCEARLGALRALIGGDKGAVGKFARCAKKRGTFDLDKTECVYDLPGNIAPAHVAWYDPASGGMKINARLFVSSDAGAGSYWAFFLHELTHAVDFKESAKWSDNECTRRMLLEARAYWRMDDKCTCKEACSRAWQSAQYGCFLSEAWRPWQLRQVPSTTQPRQQTSQPADPEPQQATWYQANREKWVSACQGECEKDGPLKSSRSVDEDCDAELGDK